MMPVLYATTEGTARYRERMVAKGILRDHFREGLGGLVLSSVGLGSYLGGHDSRTDRQYLEAVTAALSQGSNVLDSAINYRCQRSERTIGQALRAVFDEGHLARDEVVITTKGGYLPFNDVPPKDVKEYIRQTFISPGLFQASELVDECHCLAPTFLRHQIAASLRNLELSSLDVYYLHNPEQQLEGVPPDEFVARMRAAFAALEEEVAAGRVRVYGVATWNGFRAKLGSKDHLSLESLVTAAREVGGPDHHFRVIQLPYNLGMLEALGEQTQIVMGKALSLLEGAKILDIYVMSSASVLQGQLTRGLPKELRTGLGLDTDAQRSIQFVRSTPGIGTALVGMRQVAHVAENLAVARHRPLSGEQFANLFK